MSDIVTLLFPVRADEDGKTIVDYHGNKICTVEEGYGTDFVATIMNIGVLLLDDSYGDPKQIKSAIDRVLDFKSEGSNKEILN